MALYASHDKQKRHFQARQCIPNFNIGMIFSCPVRSVKTETLIFFLLSKQLIIDSQHLFASNKAYYLWSITCFLKLCYFFHHTAPWYRHSAKLAEGHDFKTCLWFCPVSCYLTTMHTKLNSREKVFMCRHYCALASVGLDWNLKPTLFRAYLRQRYLLKKYGDTKHNARSSLYTWKHPPTLGTVTLFPIILDKPRQYWLLPFLTVNHSVKAILGIVSASISTTRTGPTDALSL